MNSALKTLFIIIFCVTVIFSATQQADARVSGVGWLAYYQSLGYTCIDMGGTIDWTLYDCYKDTYTPYISGYDANFIWPHTLEGYAITSYTVSRTWAYIMELHPVSGGK